MPTEEIKPFFIILGPAVEAERDYLAEIANGKQPFLIWPLERYDESMPGKVKKVAQAAPMIQVAPKGWCFMGRTPAFSRLRLNACMV